MTSYSKIYSRRGQLTMNQHRPHDPKYFVPPRSRSALSAWFGARAASVLRLISLEHSAAFSSYWEYSVTRDLQRYNNSTTVQPTVQQNDTTVNYNSTTIHQQNNLWTTTIQELKRHGLDLPICSEMSALPNHYTSLSLLMWLRPLPVLPNVYRAV